MSNRITINIGVNNPTPQPGYIGLPPLPFSEADAELMYHIANSTGFTTDAPYGLITGSAATLQRVRGALQAAARALVPGDLLLLTFSGHSCKYLDTNDDEDDGLDEAWCLADLPLINDELSWWLAQFKPQVRILLIVDSCFSNGALMQWMLARLRVAHAFHQSGVGFAELTAAAFGELLPPPPPDSPFNREIQAKFPWGKNVHIQATVLLVASCDTGELSQNGLFTKALSNAWYGTPPMTSYGQLYLSVCAVVQRANGAQHPKVRQVGTTNMFFFSDLPIGSGNPAAAG